MIKELIFSLMEIIGSAIVLAFGISHLVVIILRKG